ncbi:MAG: uracil-DNA glycosylase [Muribaculaceae bacterium]|nr:uracil-DNA glycosylase [Muribaculaceae bacterium]
MSATKEVRIEAGWKRALADEFEKPYFKQLSEVVRREYANPAVTVYPPAGKIFAAFDASPFEETKVVIIGQDPYHGPGQANGLSFSVDKGVAFPPSLRNIFKEVSDDTGAPIPADGDLTRWARQGVLLLNSSLTVREHQPQSHADIGWQYLTDAAVRKLAEERANLVFILWGSHAIKKGAFIDRNRHLVLTSAHPSPLSAHRGFFGNRHFSKANEYLIAHGKTPVEW